jgi:hypothetical protein
MSTGARLGSFSEIYGPNFETLTYKVPEIKCLKYYLKYIGFGI